LTGVLENQKGNQATFDNSQRNNLRSCVWVPVGFGGGFLLVRRKFVLCFLFSEWHFSQAYIFGNDVTCLLLTEFDAGGFFFPRFSPELS